MKHGNSIGKTFFETRTYCNRMNLGFDEDRNFWIPASGMCLRIKSAQLLAERNFVVKREIISIGDGIQFKNQ